MSPPAVEWRHYTVGPIPTADGDPVKPRFLLKLGLRSRMGPHNIARLFNTNLIFKKRSCVSSHVYRVWRPVDVVHKYWANSCSESWLVNG